MSKPITATKKSFSAPHRRTLCLAVCTLAALMTSAAIPAFSADDAEDKDFDKAAAAYQEKDYETALKRFKKSAEKGNATAMFNVGVIYKNGLGVRKDDDEAFQWFLKSAEKGFANAQYLVSQLYEFGEGVPADSEAAFQWLLKAAENRNPSAMDEMGRAYANGLSVDKNMDKAVELFKEAINLGCIDACVDLGKLYLAGNGVEQDFIKAAKLFLDAAKKENPDGAFQLAECYRKNLVEAADIEQISMSPSGPFDTSGNYKGALKWYLLAAEKGHTEAQYRYGTMRGGDKRKEMLEKAAKKGHLWALYKAASASNPVDIVIRPQEWYNTICKAQREDPENPDLLFWLGIANYTGLGMDGKGSKKIAWELFVKAGQKGNAWSQNHVGEVLLNGDSLRLNIDKDEKTALEWFKVAAEQGYALAQFNLAECYAKGKGVEENDEEAVKWYLKAAEPRYSDSFGDDNEKAEYDAAYQLGKYYERGWGVEKNEAEAFKYYRKSAGYDPQPRYSSYEINNLLEKELKVAQCYETGMGTKKDISAAEKIYRAISNSSHNAKTNERPIIAEAYYKLAIMHNSPDNESFELKEAARYGHTEAQKYCREHNISW